MFEISLIVRIKYLMIIYYRNDTKMNVDKLKPFTLYQFKVKAIKHDTNQTSLYSESIECYTNEDGENSTINCLIE
jgi:hypothetical protein